MKLGGLLLGQLVEVIEGRWPGQGMQHGDEEFPVCNPIDFRDRPDLAIHGNSPFWT